MQKKQKNKHISSEAMEIRKTNLIKLIDISLEDIDNEIKLHEKGEEGDATVTILTSIKVELEKMKYYMAPQKYVPTYNYIIRERWNEFTHTGEILLKVVQCYKEKIY